MFSGGCTSHVTVQLKKNNYNRINMCKEDKNMQKICKKEDQLKCIMQLNARMQCICIIVSEHFKYNIFVNKHKINLYRYITI